MVINTARLFKWKTTFQTIETTSKDLIYAKNRINVGKKLTFSELIRNQTLKFLSKTLPVLKADDTLPKVTQIPEEDSLDVLDNNGWVTHKIHLP